MVNSDILFVVIPDLINNYGIIPAKLFEYIASKTKIILIGDRKSDAAKLMNTLGYKYFYNTHDIINFDEIINDDFEYIARSDIFSRLEQTKQLSKIFDKISS